MQCLYNVYLEEFKKWEHDRLMYTIIFKRVLDIVRIKIGHFIIKGENKWEALKVSIQMNWSLKGSKPLSLDGPYPLIVSLREMSTRTRHVTNLNQSDSEKI